MLLKFLLYQQRNVSEYEFLTVKDVLPEKDLLEKAATMKRFEYLSLGKELKTETGNAKNERYQVSNSITISEIRRYL